MVSSHADRTAESSTQSDPSFRRYPFALASIHMTAFALELATSVRLPDRSLVRSARTARLSTRRGLD